MSDIVIKQLKKYKKKSIDKFNSECDVGGCSHELARDKRNSAMSRFEYMKKYV